MTAVVLVGLILLAIDVALFWPSGAPVNETMVVAAYFGVWWLLWLKWAGDAYGAPWNGRGIFGMGGTIAWRRLSDLRAASLEDRIYHVFGQPHISSVPQSRRR